jgi:hypothetical protein
MAAIHATSAWGNLSLTQKQLTSTTEVQFEFAIEVSKQLTTQVGKPLKLGYSAELVELALVVDDSPPV